MKVLLLPAVLLLAAAAAPAGDGAVPGGAGGCGTCHGAERVLHEKSVHRPTGISCVDCHGGDPTQVESKEKAHAEAVPGGRGFTGKVPRALVPETCASCHADVARMRPFGLRTDIMEAYRTGSHGKALAEKGDVSGATCTDCHGVHDIRRGRDPLSPAHRENVPATCGRCHADASLMKRHGLGTEAPAAFAGSVHGRLLALGEAGAPTCATCHDAHAAAPPRLTEVTAVCGTCHLDSRDLYRQSPHFAASRRGLMGQCTACHGDHAIGSPGYEAFGRRDPADGGSGAGCLDCHDAADPADAGSAAAVRLEALFRDADGRMEEASSRIVAVAADGFFTDEERDHLESARRELVRAVPLVHTLDLPRVEAAVRRSVSFTEQALAGCDRKRRDSRDRHLYGTFTAVVLLGLAGLLRARGGRDPGAS